MSWILRSILVFFIIVIFCITPALLLWYLGYLPVAKWNRNSLETRAYVVDRSVTDRQCSYDCNCMQVCMDKTCVASCDRCYYPCHDLQAKIEWKDLRNATFSTWIVVGTGYRDNPTTIAPIGSWYLCYYQEADPTDMKLDKNGNLVLYHER